MFGWLMFCILRLHLNASERIRTVVVSQRVILIAIALFAFTILLLIFTLTAVVYNTVIHSNYFNKWLESRRNAEAEYNTDNKVVSAFIWNELGEIIHSIFCEIIIIIEWTAIIRIYGTIWIHMNLAWFISLFWIKSGFFQSFHVMRNVENYSILLFIAYNNQKWHIWLKIARTLL